MPAFFSPFHTQISEGFTQFFPVPIGIPLYPWIQWLFLPEKEGDQNEARGSSCGLFSQQFSLPFPSAHAATFILSVPPPLQPQLMVTLLRDDSSRTQELHVTLVSPGIHVFPLGSSQTFPGATAHEPLAPSRALQGTPGDH